MLSTVMIRAAVVRGIRQSSVQAAAWYQDAVSQRVGFTSKTVDIIHQHGSCLRPHAADTATRHYASDSQAPQAPISRGATILDGKKVARQWVEQLAKEAQIVAQHIKRPPGLAVVLVGNRADSLLYVTRKQEACEKAGIRVTIHRYLEDVSQPYLEAEVIKLCSDPTVDGVLIQLPLSKHLDEEAVMEKLDPKKDVDGFHPLNMGRMLMRGRVARLVPCTPLGIMELLQRSGIEVQGRSAVVVGDSNIVGTPLAALLRDQGAAAVTVCHRTSYKDWCGPASTQKRAQISGHLPNPLTQIPGPSFAKTNTRGKSQQQAGAHQAGHAGELESTMQAATSYAKQHLSGCQGQPDTAAHQLLPAVTKGADILVVAVGVPEMVKKEWVKPGAVVVDVGINVVPQPRPAEHQASRPTFAPGTYHVVGDVAFSQVSEVAAAITPVPGGVGPMTIAAVLYNTLRAAKYNCGLLHW